MIEVERSTSTLLARANDVVEMIECIEVAVVVVVVIVVVLLVVVDDDGRRGIDVVVDLFGYELT